jgi:hypothetical protein
VKGNERNGALQTIVHGKIGVKLWLLAIPSVDVLRPGICPVCGQAGCPTGGDLGIVGHGLRERQFRGPPEPGQVLDPEKNEAARSLPADLSTPQSRVRILAIATNEEMAIARFSYGLLSNTGTQSERIAL